MHHNYMWRAVQLAEQGRGKTSPNPLVGAVVVKDGEIIGEGFHERAGKPHAEVIALKKAGKKAKGADLFVTLEPCCHYGRTPPCVNAIIKSRIARVYVGLVDPNPQVRGRGIEILREAGIKVEVGLLSKEISQQNEVFIKYILSGMPFVTLKMGLSLDGKTATRLGESKWITSEDSRLEVQRLRSLNDSIMVGIGTVLKDNPSLTVRLTEKNKAPLRIILDSQAKLPLSSKIVKTAKEVRTFLAVTKKAASERIKLLKSFGLEVKIFPSKKGKVDLKKLLKYLGKIEISSVLLEGGPTLNAAFLEEKLIDKFVFFISPKIIGGKDSLGVFGGIGVSKLSESLRVKLAGTKFIGEDIMVTAYPVY